MNYNVSIQFKTSDVSEMASDLESTLNTFMAGFRFNEKLKLVTTVPLCDMNTDRELTAEEMAKAHEMFTEHYADALDFPFEIVIEPA